MDNFAEQLVKRNMTKSEKINYDFLFRYIIVGDMGKKNI